MAENQSSPENTETEIARRRDALARHMLSAPPQPLKPKAAAKEKPISRASAGKREPSA
jgi:hypothetical protein